MQASIRSLQHRRCTVACDDYVTLSRVCTSNTEQSSIAPSPCGVEVLARGVAEHVNNPQSVIEDQRTSPHSLPLFPLKSGMIALDHNTKIGELRQTTANC